MKVELDDDVVIVRLVEGLTSVGLTVTHDGRGGLRIHNAPRRGNVIVITGRRMSAGEIDRCLRQGMKHLFRDDGPGAA